MASKYIRIFICVNFVIFAHHWFHRLPYFDSPGLPVFKPVIRQCLGVKGLVVFTKKKFYHVLTFGQFHQKYGVIVQKQNNFSLKGVPYFDSPGLPVFKLVIRQCLGVKGLRIEILSFVLSIICSFYKTN